MEKLRLSDKSEELPEVPYVQTAQDRRDESCQLEGAMRAMVNLSKALSAATIRGQERFFKEGRHVDFGFKDQNEYLNSERSWITRHQYYDRLEVLNKEGDELFDLFNTTGVPLSVRKLLGGKDEVRIEGKHVVIGDARIRRDDVNGILRAIKILKNKEEEMARTIATGKAENKAQKKLIEKATAPHPLNSIKNDFYGALLTVTGAVDMLVAEAEKLSPEQREKIRSEVFATIGQQTLRLDEALGLEVPESVKRGKLKLD